MIKRIYEYILNKINNANTFDDEHCECYTGSYGYQLPQLTSPEDLEDEE